MSGQQPWQPPDGGWYPSGQGAPQGAPLSSGPGRPHKEKPGKKPEKKSFLDWISTTAGVISAICAVITLAVGTVVVVKVFSPPQKPALNQPSSPNSSSHAPSPSPTLQNPPANLTSALLPSSTLSSAAYIVSKGTDLSKTKEICGAPVYGATATAYEQMVDHQSGTALEEALVTWASASDAGQAVTSNRQAVDQNPSEGCSLTGSGSTATYMGDDEGSPPSSCASPGQYFATTVTISFSSSGLAELPESGYVVEAQCGATTISIRVYGGFANSITQQTADGYLSSAIGNLDSAHL
jgi:hypothetical protein